MSGPSLCRPVPSRSVQPFRAVRLDVAAAETERYRLHNLSPQKGSRRDEKRKGRGYGGHQVIGPMAIVAGLQQVLQTLAGSTLLIVHWQQLRGQTAQLQIAVAFSTEGDQSELPSTVTSQQTDADMSLSLLQLQQQQWAARAIPSCHSVSHTAHNSSSNGSRHCSCTAAAPHTSHYLLSYSRQAKQLHSPSPMLQHLFLLLAC